MKTVIFLGKRTAAGSPLAQWPGAELAGTTHSNQKYRRRCGEITDWSSWWDLHPFNETRFPGHPPSVYEGIKKRRPATYRWYQTLPGPDQPGYRPLWLLELDPTIPAGVRFPVEEVLDAFPIRNGNGSFYTCQVDWMMAFHILRGYEHIILHGHGVSEDPTFFAKHRGVIHWVTLARERGIQVTINAPSWYLAPKRAYGIASGGWEPGLR